MFVSPHSLSHSSHSPCSISLSPLYFFSLSSTSCHSHFFVIFLLSSLSLPFAFLVIFSCLSLSLFHLLCFSPFSSHLHLDHVIPHLIVLLHHIRCISVSYSCLSASVSLFSLSSMSLPTLQFHHSSRSCHSSSRRSCVPSLTFCLPARVTSSWYTLLSLTPHFHLMFSLHHTCLTSLLSLITSSCCSSCTSLHLAPLSLVTSSPHSSNHLTSSPHFSISHHLAVSVLPPTRIPFVFPFFSSTYYLFQALRVYACMYVLYVFRF